MTTHKMDNKIMNKPCSLFLVWVFLMASMGSYADELKTGTSNTLPTDQVKEAIDSSTLNKLSAIEQSLAQQHTANKAKFVTITQQINQQNDAIVNAKKIRDEQAKAVIKLEQQQKITDERLKYQDLRKELLDRQESGIDLWLTVVGIFLTFLALAGTVGAWIFKKRTDQHISREIENFKTQAQGHADDIELLKEQAQTDVNEIKGLKAITAESVDENPEESEEIIKEAQESGTKIEKQIATALQQQKDRNIKQAIASWRNILAIAEYNDDIELKEWSYSNLGYLLDEDKQFDEAIEAYQQVIAINPKDDAAYYNMGISYAHLEQYSKAIEAYQQAITINPKKDEAYNNMGISYNDLKKYPEAIEAYQQATAINPKQDNAYINMGISYNNLKKYPEAIEAYQQAIAINPKDDAAYNNLFELYLMMGEKYPAHLVKQFKETCSDNNVAMMMFAMLTALKEIEATNVVLTAEQYAEFEEEYQGLSFGSFSWKELEQWIETKENKQPFLKVLAFFKKFN